jgi:hypothetical protein
VPLLHPPQQVDAVREAFDAGDAVRQVKEKVSSIPGSIRGHGMRIAEEAQSGRGPRRKSASRVSGFPGNRKSWVGRVDAVSTGTNCTLEMVAQPRVLLPDPISHGHN